MSAVLDSTVLTCDLALTCCGGCGLSYTCGSARLCGGFSMARLKSCMCFMRLVTQYETDLSECGTQAVDVMSSLRDHACGPANSHAQCASSDSDIE